MAIKGKGNIVRLNRRTAKCHPIYTITIPRAIAEALDWKIGDLLRIKILTRSALNIYKPKRQHYKKLIRDLEDV